MKINPIGIQSYQQLNRRDNQTVSKTADENQAQQLEQKVSITPQPETSESKLSVKVASGNYADFLSPEEKSALDLLFSRFSNSERFGAGYNKDVSTDPDNASLGKVIDVKV